MLVLARKYGERIYIGEDITIFVTRIEQSRVWIGIEAPRDIPIYRGELIDTKPPLPGEAAGPIE